MLSLYPVRSFQPEYAFVEKLLHTSFPSQERRNDTQQRLHTDTNKRFTAYIVQENGENTGLATIWSFPMPVRNPDEEKGNFAYVEHLAIAPEKRNGGIGSRVLQTLAEHVRTPIVLEVETPEDELSRRRIRFYQRNGFELCRLPYRQPSYSLDGTFLPMYLMHCGWKNFENCFEKVKESIYREVYGFYEEKDS